MVVSNTSLHHVKTIHPLSFEDHRGEYVETYNVEEYKKKGITVDFVQDDYSTSSKGVLRGLHGDDDTWKLVSCPSGKIYLVVLDLDDGSPTQGQWQSFVLSSVNKIQVLVPPKHLNGHLVLSESAIFSYKQSAYYRPKGQMTIRYDDPRYNIWWPTSPSMLSKRDELGQYPDDDNH